MTRFFPQIVGLASEASVPCGFCQAVENQEPLPVPYRYNLTPARSGKCNVFLPNALRDGEVPKHLHSCKVPCVASWPEWPNRLFLRHATVGAVWVSHMDKLPRSNMAAGVWEAMLSEAVCVFSQAR